MSRVSLLNLENIVAGENHVLHGLVDRRRLPTIHTGGGVFHRGSEIGG